MPNHSTSSDLNPILNRWLFEGISWVAAVIIALLVLLPVWRYHVNYPILFENFLGIVVAVQIARMIFLYRHIPYLQGIRSKTAALLMGIILLLMMVRYFSGVATFIKDVGFYEMFAHQAPEAMWSLARYMNTQLIFFYTAAIAGLVVLPVVLLKAIWRQYNHR